MNHALFRCLLFTGLSALSILSAQAAAALEGDLLAADRVNARRALQVSIGVQEADEYALASGGCDFSTCTSVVTRYATFTRPAGNSPQGMQRRFQVQCSGRLESSWQCGSPLMLVSFVMDSITYDIRVDTDVSDEQIVSTVRYLRSPCFATAVSTYPGKRVIPRWAVRAPITGIRSEPGGHSVSVGDAYAGVRISLVGSDDAACPYRISDFTGWVV